MTNDKEFISTRAPEPVGPYPHARRVGDLLYLSGVGPRTKNSKTIPGVTLDDNNNIVAYDVEVQTKAVIENIRTILDDAGLTLNDLVDMQVYLTNMKADFRIFNEVYQSYFKAETGPCRTTIEVGALPTPIAVEIKALAKFKS